MKKSSSSMNILFRGIPLSHKDKIHEYIQMLLLRGKRIKGGSLASYFNSFLQIFERGFLHKIPHFDEKEWPIKAG